jgi:hypothetical protein
VPGALNAPPNLGVRWPLGAEAARSRARSSRSFVAQRLFALRLRCGLIGRVRVARRSQVNRAASLAQPRGHPRLIPLVNACADAAPAFRQPVLAALRPADRCG